MSPLFVHLLQELFRYLIRKISPSGNHYYMSKYIDLPFHSTEFNMYLQSGHNNYSHG